MDKSENNFKIQPITKITSKHYQLFLDADPSRKIVDSYLDRAYKFELMHNDVLLGVLLMLDTRPETVEIVNIAVDESVQNQGLGEKLVRFAIDWAEKRQYHTIEIGTGSTSFAQLYLYQKCGFRVINIDRNFFVDNYDAPIIENKLILKDMIRMEKKINSTSREVAEKNLAEAIKDIPVEHLESQKDIDAWLKKHPEDNE
ncbi:GNAT family N-acetyltransferase [Companilactobacillus muriivasis]|uniref:GNAT family N-acetyltransferase n=1 Tax=Companilactobacillus muriivasis TaxID=3081444 RepID=UPI0030C6B4F3